MSKSEDGLVTGQWEGGNEEGAQLILDRGVDELWVKGGRDAIKTPTRKNMFLITIQHRIF